MELKNLSSYELIDTLIASRERPGKEMERAIPLRETVELRQRALEAGLPIADQQGMQELVYTVTDSVAGWNEDLSNGWSQSAGKREVMDRARASLLAITRQKAHSAGLTGWAAETEANRLVENPDEDLLAQPAYLEAKENFILKRSEYVIEYGTVHSHLRVRQQQLQELLDGMLTSRKLPTVVLHFRESGATVPHYGRGAAQIELNNNDLFNRSRAPLIVSLIAGQLTVSHHDMQIVHALIDQLKESPRPGKLLTPAQLSTVMNNYRNKTGSYLAPEFAQRVAACRRVRLPEAELSRADALAKSFMATKSMNLTHQHKSRDVKEAEEFLRQLNGFSDDDLFDFVLAMFELDVDDSLPLLIFGGRPAALKPESPARMVLDPLRKAAMQSRSFSKPDGDKQEDKPASEEPGGTLTITDTQAQMRARAEESDLELRYEFITFVQQRVEALRDAQKRSQKEYLQNLHAKESVVLSADAYSQSVTRISRILKYNGIRPRRLTGMEDACVHHDHAAYLDVHGL